VAAVVLRYLMDQTDLEIAAALGCSTGTVRSHLSHGRSALRLAATVEREFEDHETSTSLRDVLLRPRA